MGRIFLPQTYNFLPYGKLLPHNLLVAHLHQLSGEANRGRGEHLILERRGSHEAKMIDYERARNNNYFSAPAKISRLERASPKNYQSYFVSSTCGMR